LRSAADVDITIDGGVSWINLLRWNEDHLGEHVALSLATYAGQTAQARFHYYTSEPSPWDFYWQVDDVVIAGEGEPIPEPAGLGLLGMALLAARRKRT
jgi:MYXO-CTERM domain-containing protein